MNRNASALSRRHFCRGSLALAGGLALWRGRSFSARAQDGDSAARRQAVSDRIAQFRRLPPDRLIEATQSVKLWVDSPFEDAYKSNQFDSPQVVFNSEWTETDEYEQAIPDTPPYTIGADDDVAGFFPTLGLLDIPLQRRKGKDISSVYHLQAVYLGRTEHPVATDVGPVTLSIGYFGLTIGGPPGEERMTKVVIPGMIGWIAESEDASFSSPLVVLPETEEHRTVALLSEGSDVFGPSLPGARVLELLDQNIGRGVVAVQVGDSAIPFASALGVAQGLGFPTDFFTVDSYRNRSTVTRSLYDRLKYLTLTQAAADGHVLWTVNSQGKKKKVAIEDAYKVKAENIKPLPNLGRYLDADDLSARDVARAPVTVVGPIFRSSVSLFEEE